MAHLLSQINVAPAKEKQFLQKKITSVEELAEYFPRRYYDFRKAKSIAELKEGEMSLVYGTVREIMLDGSPACIVIKDAEGYTMKIFFWGSTWAVKDLQLGDMVYFGGKIGIWGFSYSMTNPVYVSKYPGKIMPIYSKIKGMSDQFLKGKIQDALKFMEANSAFSQEDQLAKTLGLMPKTIAYRELHLPQNEKSFKNAVRRVDFDHIWQFYEDIHRSQRYAGIVSPQPVKSHEKLDEFIASLPFPLTHGQSAAVASIRDHALNGKKLDAIVSGDVGCGKTLVAISAAVLMWENHLQTSVMAPTLVLAKQHYEEFTERLEPFGVRVALMTSETKKKEKTKLLKELDNGEIDILIGTQSILSPDIRFNALGMTIIDEEHKFGVQQKELLEEFDKLGAHHISMTATPIPRSYAMTVYGESVDIITIPDKPAGRKETITKQIYDHETAFERIYDEIQKGHQAYLITPFIEESESEQFKDIASVDKMLDEATNYYRKNMKNVRIASINGDMRQSDILAVIDAFAAGEYDLLVSTTIVEVGVNIPNATAIVIMNAERFGLAGLHQLRGRVGRKGDQGYCYLVSDKLSQKLDVLCNCSNGFEIAEQDMLLRGPGDLTGSSQTGDQNTKVIETILKRPKMAALIREHIFN